MANNVAEIAKAKGITTAAAQTYVAERLAAMESNGWQSLAGGLVLMAVNPSDALRLMAGLTPPLAKAVRAEVLAKTGGNDDAVKLWMADLRKAARLAAGVSEAALKADVANGNGPDGAKAAQWLEGLRLRYQGQTVAAAAKAEAEALETAYGNRHKMRLAHKAKFEEKREAAAAPAPAPAPVAAPDGETVIDTPAPAPATDAPEAVAATPKVRLHNLAGALADMLAHGVDSDDVSQKDVAAIVALMAQLATERTARKAAALMAETADRISAPTAEAEAIAAANEAAEAEAKAAPAKGKRRAA